MAQCQVKLRSVPHLSTAAGRGSHKTTGRGFHANPGSLFLQDLSDTVVQLTGCVIDLQENTYDNPLATLVINNRPGVKAFQGNLKVYKGDKPSPGELVYKTTSTFSDAKRMKEAARDTFVMLRALTRVGGTHNAEKGYHFYLGKKGQNRPGRYIGQSFSGFQAIPESELTADRTITIIGPLTTYGRKLYWNPKGGKTVVKRFDAKKIKKILGIKRFQGGFIGTETIHSDVKKRMRRKPQFKSMSFSDPFYNVPRSRIHDYSGNYGDTMKRPLRMPAITIQMKTRGRVN